MGVKVTGRKYTNQFNSDVQETDWLLGNTGDWQRLELTFEASVDFYATTSESVSLDHLNKTITLNNGKKWSDYGFDIGDVVSMRFTREYLDDDDETQTSSAVSNLTIANLYGSVLEHTTVFTADYFLATSMLPTDRGTEKLYNVYFETDKTPEGLRFYYSHITNEDSETTNLKSIIDGTETVFSFAGLQNIAIGSYEAMNPDGLQSGMAIEIVQVTRLGRKEFAVRVDFMIGSLFDSPTDFENNFTDSLFNEGSLTDNFTIEVYPEWNNPNTVIRNDLSHTARLGNTGWFDENFNGLDNDFVLESLKYFDEDGAVVTSLDYSGVVIIEAEISGIQNLADGSEFNIGFSWIPQDSESYYNKETPYHQNLLISTAKKYSEGAINLNENTGDTVFQGSSFSDARMNIVAQEDVMFSLKDENTVKVKARFEPTADFFSLFDEKSENDRKYIIWVSVADVDLQINFSNRVSMLLDYNDLIKNIPATGPLDGMINKFIEHPREEDVLGEGKYYGHIEDDVLCRINFNIDKSKFIQEIGFGYEIENVDTGLSYTLEDFVNNTSAYPSDSNGIQQIEIDDIRGFKLVSGNNKDYVKISRNENLDQGDSIAYQCMFGSKMRWEDWIARNGVPEEFFNNELLNTGYHNNWLDYLRNTGEYKLNFFVTILFVEDGELKQHKNTFELELNGYDENLNITTEHNYYRDSDDTLLNLGTDDSTGKPLGVILSNEKTRIEIIYTNLAGDFDFDKIYGVTSLEVDKGAGEFDYRQLSSKWLSESDNPLIPVDGEDNLKLEMLASNIVKTTCLIDPSSLEKVSRYKITGRIGCAPEGTDISTTVVGIYESAYESAYE